MSSPNILLIIADQWSTRIADGGGNYASGVQTPAVDRLARDGVRFTQSYALFPLCCPPRAIAEHARKQVLAFVFSVAVGRTCLLPLPF